MPIIPAVWENEAGGSGVQGQPGLHSETLSLKNKQKKPKNNKTTRKKYFQEQ
jgi:hypothetical protein